MTSKTLIVAIISSVFGFITAGVKPVKRLFDAMNTLYQQRKDNVLIKWRGDEDMLKDIRDLDNYYDQPNYEQKTTPEEKIRLLYLRLTIIIRMYKDDEAEVLEITLNRLDQTIPKMKTFTAAIRRNIPQWLEEQELIRTQFAVANQFNAGEQVLADNESLHKSTDMSSEEREFRSALRSTRKEARSALKDQEKMLLVISEVISSFELMKSYVMGFLPTQDIQELEKIHADLLQAQTHTKDMHLNIPTHGCRIGHRNFGKALSNLKAILERLLQKYEQKIDEPLRQDIEEFMLIVLLAEKFAPTERARHLTILMREDAPLHNK